MPAWQTWGEAANRALDEVARAVPDFDKLAKSLRAEMTPEEADLAQTRLSRIGKLAAKALGALAGCPQWDEKGPTGWRCQLVDAVTKQTRDPDIDVAQWLGGHTPLGIDRPIVPRGVFQWTDITKAQEASAEYLAALNGQGHIDRNYTSFHEHEEESRKELGRLIQAGHLEPLGSWNEVTSKWPGAKATKLATLVKPKADGSLKIRFIADMRRSGINGMVHLEERLPYHGGPTLSGTPWT